MKIDTNKIRAFFRRTGKLESVSWDENIYVPLKTRTIQPDKRLSFNDTFMYIHKQLKK